ncbi:hypothetical protein VTL71DRAFT_814 [Oculimacula yallundae]|uniref:Uncharacterized protein n=1 Tax=Oculimacula yallundae TaxID=86028 RepID=A0ABR4D3E1_9HELO
MQFTSTLLTLAVLSSRSLVFAFCYSEGSGWGTNKNVAETYGAIEDLCVNGHLSGYFNEGQSKQFCVPLSDLNKHAILQVVWLGKGGHDLWKDDCWWRLKDILHDCGDQPQLERLLGQGVVEIGSTLIGTSEPTRNTAVANRFVTSSHTRSSLDEIDTHLESSMTIYLDEEQ